LEPQEIPLNDLEARNADPFSLEGKVAIVTGGTGILGGAMARGLAQRGARVGILGRRKQEADRAASEIAQSGGEALPLLADVLDKRSLEDARDVLFARWDHLDILVNAAGGNVPAATIGEDATFFELPEEPLRDVFDLNLLGSMLPSQVFGEAMARGQSSEVEGSIVNISSMAAQKPLTRVAGYSAAKAAVENFTRWLAVELAHKHGPGLRVNAIAPGFFLGEQNRRLLVNEDGSLTKRGQAIIEHTPAGRFGQPEELVGTLIWLCSSAARFVTGVVVPVDGGFGAFSGV
jgi:NAD(P)-dependent dehydrogenase (short-subunit alcohol dehydrogenase family)